MPLPPRHFAMGSRSDQEPLFLFSLFFEWQSCHPQHALFWNGNPDCHPQQLLKPQRCNVSALAMPCRKRSCLCLACALVWAVLQAALGRAQSSQATLPALNTGQRNDTVGELGKSMPGKCMLETLGFHLWEKPLACDRPCLSKANFGISLTHT